MLPHPSFEPYAILVADMVGYSRRLAQQPLETYRAFTDHLKGIFEPGVRRHSGHFIKSTGDGIVAIFKQPDDAESCARDLQTQLRPQDIDPKVGTSIKYRIAVHYGNILLEQNDVWGVDVNTTIHMEHLAPPGGVCISGAMFNRLRVEGKERYIYIGRKYLKNIVDPVDIYCYDGRNFPSDLEQRLGEPSALRRRTLSPPPRLGVAELQAFGDVDVRGPIAKIAEETVLRELSRFRDLFTISRVGSSRLPLADVSSTGLRSKSNIDFFLHGSLMLYKDQMHCTLHLERALTGDLIWSNRTALDSRDLQNFERKIADEIVAPIVLYLQREEEASWTPTRKTENEDLFRSAKSLMARGTIGAIEQARQILTKILNVSGDVADVHLALARAEHLHGRLLAGPEFVDALERATIHAKIAMEIDDLNPQAYAELALQEMFLKRQTNAIALYERALRMNPYDPMLVADWADCLVFMGRAQEAETILEKVAAGWPRDRAWVLWNLCDAEWALDRPDKIINIMSAQPDLPHVHRYLAASYAKLGRLTEAKHHAEKVLHHQPSFSTKKWSDVTPYTESDHSEEYAEFLQKAGL